jgi:hypothetical protein
MKDSNGRIYHHYELWEDWKCGFYDSVSGVKRKKMIQTVIETFSNNTETYKLMKDVISKWKYSIEENFTNPSINKVAYLGQACLCLKHGIPASVTRLAWSDVTESGKKRANEIAEQVIKEWKNEKKVHGTQCVISFPE